LNRLDVPGSDQRTRNCRSSDGSGWMVDRRAKNGLGIEIDAEQAQAIEHGTNPIDARPPLFFEERLAWRRLDIDEISEDVDVSGGAHGGDFNARDEGDSTAAAFFGRSGAARARIVIGHAEDVD